MHFAFLSSFFLSLFADVLFDIRLCFPILVSLGVFSFFFLPDGGLAFGVLSVGHGGIMVCFFVFCFVFSASVRGVRRREVGGTVHGLSDRSIIICFFFSLSYFYHLSTTTATAATTDIIITLHSIAL